MNPTLLKAILYFLTTTATMFLVLMGINQQILPEPAVLIGLFGPALWAVVFARIDGKGNVLPLLKQYVQVKAHPVYYLFAIFLIPALLLMTLFVTDFTGLVNYEQWFRALVVPQMIFIPLISIGEELGWRGYLQPQLRKQYSLVNASFIVGVIWALWHLPGYFFNTGVVEGVSFIWFMAWVISGALLMGFLYERTKSVFMAILFHTSANASFNMILILPAESGSDLPFKLFTVVAALSAILIFWLTQNGKPRHRE